MTIAARSAAEAVSEVRRRYREAEGHQLYTCGLCRQAG